MPRRDKTNPTAEQKLDWLLGELLIDHGMDSDLTASDLLRQNGHISADEFASTFLIADGMTPEYNGEEFRKIRNLFTDQFGLQLSGDSKSLGPGHPHVDTSLNNQAALYRVRGCYAETEVLYKRTSSIWGLIWLYEHQGRYAEAEPLVKRWLTIWEKKRVRTIPM